MSKKVIPVAEYIKQQIALSDKSQKDISREAGFSTPNNISMIKDGITKLPINRIPSIAKALNIDPVHLLRMTMREYMPETWSVIETVFGQSLMTDNERNLLEVVRKASRGVDLDFKNAAMQQKLLDAIEPFIEAEIKDRSTAAHLVDRNRGKAKA